MTAPADVVRRWAASGGIWRVVARGEDGVEVVLLTCSGDEEMGRLVSGDPELLALIGDRDSSED